MQALQHRLDEWSVTNGVNLANINPTPELEYSRLGVGFLLPPDTFSSEERDQYLLAHVNQMIQAIELNAAQVHLPLQNYFDFVVQQSTFDEGEGVSLACRMAGLAPPITAAASM